MGQSARCAPFLLAAFLVAGPIWGCGSGAAAPDDVADDAAWDAGDAGDVGDAGDAGPTADPGDDTASDPGDDTASDPGDPGPTPPATVALPPKDASARAAVIARLRELRAAQGIAAARATVAQEFAAGPSPIASTRLESDGTTLGIRFQDGLGAAILTNEDAFPDLPAATDAAIRRGAAVWRPAGPPRVPAAESSCDDIVMPTSLKVHIVNLAGASNNATHAYVDRFKQTLVDLGWDAEDVVVTERDFRDDRSITPEALFDQQGYGMVFVLGHGAIVKDDAGAEHFILQSFRGGDWTDGYQEHVSKARFDQYGQWLQDGELVEATAWNPTKQDYLPEFYLRDDRIAKEMRLEPGAMVSFISCNSFQLSDELSAAGAGAVLGWDGPMQGTDGLATWKALMAQLVVDGASDQQAVDALHATGLGYSTDHVGTQTVLRPGSDDHAFHLPRKMTLTAGPDCLPEEGAGVEVVVSHPDCPERDRTFVALPGGEIPVPGLYPVGTEVRFKVKDDQGTTIAGGWYAVDPSVQGASEALCPCDGRVHLDLAAIPLEAPYAATSLHVEAVPDDPTVPGRAFDVPVPPLAFEDLIPGEFTFRMQALAADGTALGSTEVAVQARCDEAPAAPACFGWLEFTGTNLPADTAKIAVAAPDAPGAVPPEVVFAPGATARMFGFALGETVLLQAEARDGLGASLAISAPTVTVACGPTPIDIDFSQYGILLTATPHRLAADGVATATISAVVRRRNTNDLLEPTGDPLPGKVVAFDTTCGTFPGAAGGTSDAQGKVSATLASSQPCLAGVRATVTADLVQSPPAYVNFDERMSFWLDGSGGAVSQAASSGYFEVECATLRYFLRDTLMIERTINGQHLGWGAYMPRAAAPGDTIRLEFSRYEDDELCKDVQSRVGPIWLHTAYPPDFTHQETRLISPGFDPLGASASVQATLQEIDYYAE